MPSHRLVPARILGALVGAVAVAAGLGVLAAWIEPGTAPGARGWGGRWPVLAVVSLVCLVVAAVVRRSSGTSTALAGIAWALATNVVTQLPPAATSFELGDGPFLLPVYLALGFAGGLYALFGPGAVAERGAVLLLVALTCNGKLFTRHHELVYALLFAFALLLAGTWGGGRMRSMTAGAGRLVVLLAAALLGWIALAALVGENRATGVTYFTRAALGAVVAWGLVVSLTDRDAGGGGRSTRRAYDAVLVGLGLMLGVVVVGLIATAMECGWERTLRTRLRFFGQHPGLVAPFLSVGVCLAVARALAVEGASAARGRLLSVGLASLAAGCLFLNQARASLLGMGVGLVALGGICVLIRRDRLPRRPMRIGIAITLLIGLGGALFVSPLGAPMRAKLDALTHTSSAWGQRYHWWTLAARATTENPLLGLGPRCEWARARLAEASYLDGTDQGTHAHNVFLSLSEGAGVPAAFLYLLLLLAILEVGRRVMVDARDRGESHRAAGIVAGVIALVAANQLSLGQAYKTFLPLFAWTALGLLAAMRVAQRSEEDPPAASKPTASILAGVGVLLLVASPAAGYVVLLNARNAQAAGDPVRALRLVDVAQRVAPWNEHGRRLATELAFESGELDRVVARAEALAAANPRHPEALLILGHARLFEGAPEEARTLFEAASNADPCGSFRDEHIGARARVALSSGDREASRSLLLEGLRLGGEYLTRIWIPLGRVGDGPAGEQRFGFPLGTGPARTVISLDELLAELEAELLRDAAAEGAEARNDARRLLGRVAALRQRQGQHEALLDLLERYAEVVPERYSNVDVLFLQAYVALGRFDEGRAILERHAGRALWVVLVPLLGASGDPDAVALAREMSATRPSLSMSDIGFEAGRSVDAHATVARFAIEDGEVAAAIAALDATLYESETAAERAARARAFLSIAAANGSAPEAIRAGLARFAEHASMDLGVGRDAESFAALAEELLGAWEGEAEALADLVRTATAGTGRTGEMLREGFGAAD